MLAACQTTQEAAYAPPSNPALAYAPVSGEPFRVAAIRSSDVPLQYRRTIVTYRTKEKPGTIIVDPRHKYLYFVKSNGRAIRYGVGVGRAGFEWNGDARVGAKRKWPKWFPPKEMQARDPRAAKYANGMDGGPHNPLGARALYLYEGNKDTLFRIHGTNEPRSIGKAMSSGCIRMLNQDVIDLYERVDVNTRVVVL
ncbi:MAG: L,D-transpeptidase [Hyphomicrobiales bacterium]|nr:L,D-transpeptidase [Hyphomicrobiales bacterium]